jgi:hypothetical protein
LLVNGFFGDIWHRKAGLAMRLGKEDGAAAALLRNQFTDLSPIVNFI